MKAHHKIITRTLFILRAQTPSSKELQIKAVFLYNFTQFVEWPAASFSEPQPPLIIGILGDDPFGASLVQTIQNEKVNGHQLIIQHYQNVNEIKTCHILFINRIGYRVSL